MVQTVRFDHWDGLKDRTGTNFGGLIVRSVATEVHLPL